MSLEVRAMLLAGQELAYSQFVRTQHTFLFRAMTDHG